MSEEFSSIVSEFKTTEQENEYNVWLKAKVEASLSDSHPLIPHNEVERRIALKLTKLLKRKTA